jgi:GT2 family glycosyltransferase
MDDHPTDDRAPAVVAVLVTRDPGPWFEETLAALAAQDYEELSVLVMVSGGAEDPTDRVARMLPDAFVRRLGDDRGYGAATNEALGMVEGAAFFLLCHDDCAPDPDAVHVMVEESYRSNAGVVSPKMLRWDDPSVLLHVGMNADKTGAVVARVRAGEVDQGQHDAVRDVFVAPGGLILVRADLMVELGGFDAAMVAMGEDLDLSWRAQVAGARVVVAPEARVRHLEAVAGGLRQVAAGPEEEAPPALQVLQRRHELRVVLKCYSSFHLLRVLPQALLLAAGEVVVSLTVGDRARARAVVGAWWWNLRRLGELRRLRAEVRAYRTLPDKEVRRLELRGSARLSTYLSRLTHQGFDVAHGRTPSSVEGASGEDLGAVAEPVLTGSVGLAFSEDADFDDLDDLGHRSGRDRFGRRRRSQALSSRRSRLVVWMLAAIVLLVGTRDLFGGGLPLVGQFLPLPSWTGSWHQLVAGWQPAGVGTTAPSTPAFGVLGILGTVLLGGMGLLQKVLVLGCIPVGAWGVSRLLRPLSSPRARLVGAVSYLGLALPYDALAQGRWDGLVAYAAVPWIVSRLVRSSGLLQVAGAPGPVGWRSTLLGQMVALGVLEAVAVAFAPAVSVVVLVCGVGVVIGSMLVGELRGSLRVLVVAAGATVVVAALCAPWVVGTVLAGRDAVSVFGLASSPASAVGWSDLLRFAVGPVGGGALSWLLVAAALLPLLIARQARLAWAGRLWTVACCSWVLALVVARGWTAPFSPSVDVLLAPAATAVAASVGLGVSAFETDLAGYRFGWRQLFTGVAVLAAAAGVLPVVADAAGGRWGLAVTGYSQPLSFLSGAARSGIARSGGYRVLWLGDPRALPIGGWTIAPGLAYATSEDGTPDAVDLWAPASPGPAAALAGAVDLARQGRTTHLGLLLAPAAVRYVVVVSALAPDIEGTQSSLAFQAPSDLVPSLLDQSDLTEVPSSGSGFSVFENTAYLPERAERTAGSVTSTGALTAGGPESSNDAATTAAGRAARPTAADVTGWHAVLPGAPGLLRYAGPLTAGTLFASYAPAGRWHLTVGGRSARETSAFGWAAQYAGVAAGDAVLRIDVSPLVPLGVLAELVLWLVVAAALLGRRRWLYWWWRPLRSRRPLHGLRHAVDVGTPESLVVAAAPLAPVADAPLAPVAAADVDLRLPAGSGALPPGDEPASSGSGVVP